MAQKMCSISIDHIKNINTKITFLIDFENVPNNIFSQLDNLVNKPGYYYVFYSDHIQTPDWILKHTPPEMQMQFIECYTGENAMDFQLIAMAGELAALNPNMIYIIVSNDKGYKPAIRMLQNKGRRIFQYKTNKMIQHDQELLSVIQKHCNENDIGAYAQNIYEIAKKTKNLQSIHNALQKCTPKAQTIYRSLKTTIEQKNLLN